MEKESQVYRGKISFVNFDKYFATIDYSQGSKQKAVNFKTDAAENDKKPHQYRLGDEVDFQLRLSDRGDKMTAYNVRFVHNPAIDLLVQKAQVENRFAAYLKKVDDRYFVKECDSYILFPLQLSPWEIPPADTAENEVISVTFLNTDRPNAMVAELFSHNYIPEYKKALQHFTHQIDIEAVVKRISPHAVYVELFGEKFQAKLPLNVFPETGLKEGQVINVHITHLSSMRVVIAKSSPVQPE